MRILVTGLTGFIGGAAASHLLHAGHEVIGVSRQAVPQANRIVTGELGSSDFVDRIAAEVAPCEAIVHAAARLDKGMDQTAVSLANCVGTQQIVALAARWPGVRIVYLSGVNVIGAPRGLPVTEDHPAHPLTCYHASKLFGEHMMSIASRSGIPTVSLRVTAPIGVSMPPNRILPVFVRRAMEGLPLEIAGRGDRRQDYVDVRDVAAAIEAWLVRPPAGGVINIGSGRSISNLELARLSIASLESKSEIRFSGAPDPEDGCAWEVSTARAKALLDYVPRYTLEDTLLSLASRHANRDPQ